MEGLAKQAGAAVQRTNAAKVLGVSPDDEAADIKRVYRKLIATVGAVRYRSPRQNPMQPPHPTQLETLFLDFNGIL